MAPSRAKTFAEEIESLYDPTPRDWDPENEGPSKDFEDSDEEVDDDEEGARDHYEDIRESALRKKNDPELGPSYTGTKISRQTLDDDSGNSLLDGSADEEDFSQEESGQDSDASGDDQRSFSGFDGDVNSARSSSPSSGTDSHTSSVSSSRSPSPERSSYRAEVRSLMSNTANPTASLARLAHADVEKGRAIKRQRMAFDSLLNTRIKLQKALVSANTIPAIHPPTDQTPSKADPSTTSSVANLESTAISLLNSLSNLHTTLSSSSSSPSEPFTSSTPSSEILTALKKQHTTSLPHRRQILTKWSQRTQPLAPLSRGSNSNKFSQAPSKMPLTSVLDQQLRGEQFERHVQKTRVPRSCAPVQAQMQARAEQSAAPNARAGEDGGGKAVEEDMHTNAPSTASVYDDADFYALLLRELVERRGASTAPSTTSNTNGSTLGQGAGGRDDGVGAVDIPKLRDVKVRKVVDRKASKGRKIRYTVHEKLQNFMVREDKGSWEERRRGELFASLLGQRVDGGGGGEEEGSEEEDEDDGEGGGGIRLFA